MPAGSGVPAFPGADVERQVSYGLRVNELDEMELFKRTVPWSCNDPAPSSSYRCVATFGGSAGARGVPLPTSVNPKPRGRRFSTRSGGPPG